MEKMQLVVDYKRDNEMRGKFNDLTQEVFGFDFEDWYQRGFWDDRYVCHSFLKNGKLVSNVSATRFELLINGKRFNAIQIGTVMTKNEFRGKGLGVELTKHVIEKYGSGNDFFYLFGHKGVWDYYKKQDFMSVHEFCYSVEAKGGGGSAERLKQLNLSNNKDLETIIRLTKSRAPVSKTFGVLNDTSIFLFYCLYDFQKNLFYSEKKDCLLVFSLDNQALHLHDILCESELNFAEISGLLKSENIDFKEIIFHYTPNYPDLEIKPTEIDTGDRMFFKGDSSILPLKFKYPKIAHT